MNRKQLTLLIVLGVVLSGLGWLAYRKQSSPYQESTTKLGEKLLPDFPLNDVAQIVIRQPAATVTIAKQDETWVVKDRTDYPANFSNIRDLLIKFADLKVVKPVKIGPSRLPQLELAGPDKGNGTLVEFKDNSGKLMKSVVLGAKSMKESGGDSPFGGGSFPNGRYVMVGSDLQSVAVVSETFSTAEAKAEDWLNKEWFKVEKIKSVSVTATNATNSFKLARESETAEWKLADTKPGEQFDHAKASGVTSALGYPSFNDLATNASPDVTGLSRPVIATLETFDGFTYTAKIGGKSGEDNYFFQIAVAGNFPKERTPGKDEKPEDKEKLDKEFKESQKKLEERLKNEKAFEKWTYVVSKWTVDALLKERKDLMAEKKEEPKAEEPKKDEPKPAEPKATEAKPAEPKSAETTEPKKDESKPAEPKKEEPKKEGSGTDNKPKPDGQ